MHIRDILHSNQPSFSFEFFPPKTESGAVALFETIKELEKLDPAFVSVTYGAGGTTRELTHDLVLKIKTETHLEPIPHLTCVCHQEQEIRSILERYAAAGISNILALGGDPPKNIENYNRANDAFPHAANLVHFIKTFANDGHHPDPHGFGIGVAGFPEGHPATPNRLMEMDYLKAKVDEGADYICTQLFFDNHDFHDFRERCHLAGIHIPILAGIMPISSLASMERMAELAAGARFPAALLHHLAKAGNNADDVEKLGIEYAAAQCQDLLDQKVDGIHFYTLNKSTATKEIYRQLNLA